MKHLNSIGVAAVLLIGSGATAASNVHPTLKHGWGENIGWTNWRDAGMPAGSQGATMAADGRFLSGFVWSENSGWITLGDGTPGTATAYTNANGSDCGVNAAPSGNLNGLAWGENIGWINFDTNTALGGQGKQARYDAAAGRLRGYAWGENVGWINLDDAVNYVAITPPCIADLNHDGAVNTIDLTILLFYFGQSVPVGTIGDLNGDGVVNTADLVAFLGRFGQPCL